MTNLRPNLSPETDVQTRATRFADRELIRRRSEFKIPLHHNNFFPLRHLKQFTDEHIPKLIQPGLKVGDIGCGEQPFRSLIKTLGGDYISIDVIQNCQENVDIIADITAIPLPAESFDVIICTEVLEHSFDPRQALQELSRLLKPEGVLLMTTPFTYPLHEIPYDFSRITPFFVEYWLPKLGFQAPSVLKRLGNELEVIATIWGHLWTSDKQASLIQRTAFAIIRAFVNLIVVLSNPLIQPFIKQNSFLTLVCITHKSAEGGVVLAGENRL